MALEVSEGPYVPVITPPGYRREEYVEPLFGQADEEELIKRRDEAFEAERMRAIIGSTREESRRRFLIYGMLGVTVGAVVTGGMTALALRSYRRSGSVVGPAIYAGLGSAAMGGAMVLILSRIVGGESVDPRVAALAIGARMAG